MSWQVPAGGGEAAGFTNTGLGVDADGVNLIIGDHTNERIVKTTPQGAFLGAISLGGTPLAQGVQGVAFDTTRGGYWVAHGNSQILRRYDTDGSVLDEFATAASGPNGISYDAVNDRILAAFSDGHMRSYNAATGAEVEDVTVSQFGTAVDGLELDPSDANAIWISVDATPCKIAKLNRTTGATILSWNAPSNVEDIAFLDGVMYVALDQEFHSGIPSGNRVWQFDPATGAFIDPAITDGLEWFYDFENAAEVGEDVYGANDLTNNNTITQVAGKVGQAGHLVIASSQHFSAVSAADFQMGNIDFTIFGWVKLTAKATIQIVLSKWNETGPVREYLIDYVTAATDRFRFAVSPDGTNTTIVTANNLGSPTAGDWYFFVAWHDATANTINIQFNNGTVDSAAHTTGVFASTAPFMIGARTNSGGVAERFLGGDVDQVGMLKRLLTDDERTWLYNSGNGRSRAEVLAGIDGGGVGLTTLTNLTDITTIS